MAGASKPPPPPGAGIDQLIERGLERYGAGDVDGALMAWEQALGLDPDDLRAAAYVDYVRENYEMLQGAPRPPDVDVPFGLGAVEGDDGYEVEVTRGEAAAKVARYIESVDEGWFLDDEAPPSAPAPIDLGEPPPLELAAPAPRPLTTVRFDSVADDRSESSGVGAPEALSPGRGRSPRGGIDELDLGPAGLEPPPALVEPEARASRLQLPLSAADDGGEGEAEAEVTLEIEADEPDDPLPGSPAMDEEQTRDFVAGAWPPPPDADLDFTDQRSAVPTREIAAPRGFVRPRPDGMAPVISASVVPVVARGPKPASTPPATEPNDDDLATRPGNVGGPGNADPLDPIRGRLSADALAEFGGPGTGTGHAGPDDRTRETPPVRVTLPAETTGESELEPGDDERTMERSAIRLDTASEPTIERGGAVRYTPAPLDDAHEGNDQSGRHPPLVIIEDPVLGVAPPVAASRVPTDELNAGTVRLKRATQTVPPATAPAVAAPGAPGHEVIAAALEREIEAAALPDEGPSDRTRRRVTELIERAIAASTAGDHATAIVALDIALAEDPESAVAQKLLHRHQSAILDCYQRYVGKLTARPALAMPMHELAGQKLDIRAAFLLSRIDGTLSFEEILDVSGMQRPEAFRHLSILLIRGILEVR